jgi:hypothetical protein
MSRVLHKSASHLESSHVMDSGHEQLISILGGLDRLLPKRALKHLQI